MDEYILYLIISSFADKTYVNKNRWLSCGLNNPGDISVLLHSHICIDPLAHWIQCLLAGNSTQHTQSTCLYACLSSGRQVSKISSISMYRISV